MSVVNPLAMKPKDPDATAPFGFNWAARLTELGTTISTSTFVIALRTGTATPALTESSRSNTTTTTQIVLAGGADGSDWDVTNRVALALSPLVEERTIVIQVRHR